MTTRETSTYIRQNIQCYGGDARQAAPRRARDRTSRSERRVTSYPTTPGNIHKNHALTRVTGGAGRWLHAPESRQASSDPSGDRRAPRVREADHAA